MAAAVVFLPLLAAIIAGFFGRVIGDRGAQLVTCGALLLSAVLGVLLFRDILASDGLRVIPLASWIIAGGVDVTWSLPGLTRQSTQQVPPKPARMDARVKPGHDDMIVRAITLSPSSC